MRETSCEKLNVWIQRLWFTTGIPLRRDSSKTFFHSILENRDDKYLSFKLSIDFNIATEFLFSSLHLIPRKRFEVVSFRLADRLKSMNEEQLFPFPNGGPTAEKIIRAEKTVEIESGWNRVQKPHPTLGHKSTAVR